MGGVDALSVLPVLWQGVVRFGNNEVVRNLSAGEYQRNDQGMTRATHYRSLFILCHRKRSDFTFQPFAELVFGNVKVILRL